MGGFDSRTPVLDEPPLGYHPCSTGILTIGLESGLGTPSGGQFDWGGRLLKSNGGEVLGHCQAGSLTGAVASQKVTEALKGSLSTVGNRA